MEKSLSASLSNNTLARGISMAERMETQLDAELMDDADELEVS